VVAVEQSRAAARNMLSPPGSLVEYGYLPAFWSSQFGLNIKSIGLADGADQMAIAQGDPKKNRFVAVFGGQGRMLRRLVGEEIALDWQPAPNLWNVKVDPAQVDQVLTNLAANSRDAIAGIGKLTVATSNVTIDEAWCQAHAGWVPGDYVMLTVSDTGKGMSQETMEHLFEPFYTTKEVGKGTGLGLSTVYGIARQHDGFIDVQSEVGFGATFRICFPKARGAATGVRREADGAAPQGTETVLVVEDDESILKLVQSHLRRLGYRVLVAHKPGDAVRLVQRHEGPLQLLLTDVVMPELNGKQLHERLLSLRPGMKALFMSGYTAELISQRGVVEAGTVFIQKPFSMLALASKVREVLDKT
jgi:CheY-like chemotaxis protein